MQPRADPATSQGSHYPHAVLHYVAPPARPASGAPPRRTGRFVAAPIGPWGGPDFVLAARPRGERLQAALEDAPDLLTRGARSQHRSTLPVAHPDPCSRPWTSETRLRFAGDPCRPPVVRALPAPSQHRSRVRLGTDDLFRADTAHAAEFPARETQPPSEIRAPGHRNRAAMLGGVRTAERLRLEGARSARGEGEALRSQYADVHCRLGRLVFAACGPRPPPAPVQPPAFRRTSGNRVLGLLREREAAVSILN